MSAHAPGAASSEDSSSEVRGGPMAGWSIRARLIVLASLLLAAVIASNAYLSRELSHNADAMVEEAGLVSTLTNAHAATKAFGDLKYWLADLAVSLLVRAEAEAHAARERLDAELALLEAYDPDGVAAIRGEVEALMDLSIQAVDAYTADRRVVGNTLMAQARTHIQAVDGRFEALVAAVEAEALAKSDASLQAAREALQLSFVFVVLASALGLLLTVVVVRSITGPLSRLVHTMSAITAGRMDIEVPALGRDEIGQMAHTLALFRDSQIERRRLAAEREKAEAALRKAQTRLKEAIETSTEGFALYDAEDRLEICNSRYREMYAGLDVAVEPGTRYEDIIRTAAEAGLIPDAQGRVEAWVAQRVRRSRALGEPYEQQRTGGRWLKISERRTEDGGVVGVFTDITELKQREAQLADLVVQLESARDEAMAASRAKSQFLASMSHELRTPLNAIIGYSEMLLEEVDELDQVALRADLEKIQSAGKHLLLLINDVLDLSKIEAGKMELYVENFDVGSMLADVASVVKPLMAKNGNEFEVQSAGELGTMRSDQTKIRQALFNLLSNAAKFTRQGRVTLVVRRLIEEDGDRLEFSVADTGIGMTAAQLERLFQAFSQAEASTSRDHGGTGLGLAITRHFAHMLGGEVTVDSEHGRGSTFTFSVPVDSAPATTQPGEAGPGPSPERALGTVLIIDDERAAHDVLGEQLAQAGYRVVHAHGGRDGLRLAQQLHPDVITLDIIMPEMDGWAVLRALKADPELRDIPIILVSILGDRDMGFTLGAADFITKPVDRKALLDAVGRYRRGDAAAEVLVVDDDEETRTMFRRTLEKGGWRVAEARNGREALEWLTRFRPALVLLDLMMPEVDGFEVLERMRSEADWHDVPVVIVTSKDLSREERQWLSGRAARIVQKGAYDRKKLFGDVHAMIAGRLTETGEHGAKE